MTDTTITTTATASEEADPELAAVTARIAATHRTADGARNLAQERERALRETLANSGTAFKHVRTTDLEVTDPESRFDFGGGDDEDSYRCSIDLTIECTPDAVVDIVTSVTDGGASVPSIQFDIPESQLAELRSKTVETAVERARAKAERIAATEDLTITDVADVEVTDDDSGFSDIVDEALANSDENNPQPNPISISESVSVTFVAEGE